MKSSYENAIITGLNTLRYLPNGLGSHEFPSREPAPPKKFDPGRMAFAG